MLPDLETAPFEPKNGMSRLSGKKSLKLLRDLSFINIESASQEILKCKTPEVSSFII